MSEAVRIEGLTQSYRRIDGFAKRFPAATRVGLHDGAQYLRAFMVDTYLSGQRLKVRTGKLRSNWQVRVLGDGRIGAAVVTNTVYAPPHEYGFNGTQTVKEHVRARPGGGAAAKEQKRVARLSPRGQAMARTEAKARGAWRAQQGRFARDQGQRTYGALRTAKRAQRRALGIQGGVEERASRALKRQAAANGLVVVRGHQRWMRLRERRFVRDTISYAGARAIEIALQRTRREVRAGATG